MKRLLLITSLALVACQQNAKTSKPTAKSEASWVALSGGCFDMGETRVYREEGPVTEVCLQPFEIWSHEVTNAEFAAFVKATDHKTQAELGWKASDTNGPGVEMAPGSAVFVPPKNPKGLNWWSLMEGAKVGRGTFADRSGVGICRAGRSEW